MTFEEQFPKVTDAEWQRAKAAAEGVAHIGEKPSFIWENIDLLDYALTPSRELVNVWRLHNQMFTGNNMPVFIEARYHPVPTGIVETYRRLTKGIPDELICRPPRVLGECGWDINSGIVNADTLNIQRHVNTLYFHGAIDYLRSLSSPTIVEIGAGYGGLAYFLKKLVPRARYYIVDLSKALVWPAVYLEVLSPGQFTFVPSGDYRRRIGSVDLVINTGSFGEMTPEQVEDYAEFIETNASLLYEENQDTTLPVSRILRKRFIPYPAVALQTFWAKNAHAISKMEAFGHMTRVMRVREWMTRAVRRLPRVKQLIKVVIHWYQ